MDHPNSHAVNGYDEAFHRAFESALNRESKRLGKSHPLFINGRACRSAAPRFHRTCPADTRITIGKFQQARPDHIRKAVGAARKAYPFWKELGWEQRLAFVRKAGEIMSRHRFEMGALLSLEIGKNRYEAMREVDQAIQLIEYYGRQMEAHQGYRFTLSNAGGERTYDTLEPYGVWAVVAPFDSPLAVSTSMIVAAIITGNTVVYKPSSKTPMTGLALYDHIAQAGLPVGIVNVLTGPGAQVGKELSNHPDIDGFIFTGCRSIGREIQRRFQKDYLRPCIMEMGGNNPAIVMPSADLEDAAHGIVQSAFSMGGQQGSACSRVYVHRDVRQDFLEALVELLRQRKIGLPTDRDTFLGPLIDASATQTFRQAVRIGRRDGRIAHGGGLLQKDEFAHGHFVEATVVDQTRADSSLLSKEYLVPVLAVAEIRSLKEALNLANGSPYGLSAGIYTQVDGEQEIFFDRIEAGTAYCNRRGGATSGNPPCSPSFGGWKGSGSTGKNAQGPYYVTQFMREQSRTVCW